MYVCVNIIQVFFCFYSFYFLSLLYIHAHYFICLSFLSFGSFLFFPYTIMYVVGSVSFSPENETVTLTFPNALASPSSPPIHIEYKGVLNDEMKGFYRSKYTHPDKPDVEKYAAVTQFEVSCTYYKFVHVHL